MSDLPTLKSEIKINGEWVDQELLPKETVEKMVEETICNAGRAIGYQVTKKEKSA